MSAQTKLLKTYAPPLATFGAFIGVWYVVHYFILSENRKFIVPPPHAVIDNAFLNGIARSELAEGLVNTGRIALFGFLIASVLALLGSVLMAGNRMVERALFP